MQFQRLRLVGFKSFVEATELLIEPGLTGVVGPNGCGKSNLLEALRWVMGATSARGLRAEGMDDVIFGGAAGRAARSHAEVKLEIDNADRSAPAAFNGHDRLEVVRRIDRGAGSTYRVNGVETRARDVQLLFADASSGSNSPALVRQGQISELIAAKPSNRRRILEEAAGVAGLNGRRQEAELRLRAAEGNLARLGDVTGELEATLTRLRREARAAERHRLLSADITALQEAALLARLRAAEAVHQAASREASAAQAAVEAGARRAAQAATEQANAAAALPALRDEAVVAAAVLQRLAIEADRVGREAAAAVAEVERLRAERTRLAADAAREAAAGADARTMLERSTREMTDLQAQLAAAPERLSRLEQALAAAHMARVSADAAVEVQAGEAAAQAARREAAVAALASARAAEGAAARRSAEARARSARLDAVGRSARAEHAGLAAIPSTDDAGLRLHAATAELARARSALQVAEAARTDAARIEAEQREAARRSEDRLGRLKSEAQGLLQLSRAGRRGAHAPALDQVTAEPGWECALAAALGEDVEAALDPAAPTYWAGADPPAVVWPAGATPLAPHVSAPAALAARLALTAVAEEGGWLRGAIPVGGRLVSRAGDLWRWDGLTVRAEAPRPAALRLAQRARLAEVEAELSRLLPDAEATASAHREAVAALKRAEDALAAVRRTPETAERAVAAARDGAYREAAEAARRDGRAQALAETLARLAQDEAEAQASIEAADADLADVRRRTAEPAPTDDPGAALARALAASRAAAAEARDDEARTRAALDGEQRAGEGRGRRRDALLRERTEWERRAASASDRAAELEARAAALADALAAATAAPEHAAARLDLVKEQQAAADARRERGRNALVEAQAAQAHADREARVADQAAAADREARATAAAHLEAAAEALADAQRRLHEAGHGDLDVLARRLAGRAAAIPADPAAVFAHLATLERQRAALGPVNLLAEDEAAEHGARLAALQADRADLQSAIAKLRRGVATLNAEGRERLSAALAVIDGHFQSLFQTLFEGGRAQLKLVEASEGERGDPLEAGLEIYACPPGKKLSTMSLMSGGEQALTAMALIFAVFLANPAPICVLDEVDAPLDDANVDRFCRMLDAMRRRTDTRFLAITHNPVTMSRMDRLYGVTMPEPGVSQLVSVDLRAAEALTAK